MLSHASIRCAVLCHITDVPDMQISWSFYDWSFTSATGMFFSHPKCHLFAKFPYGELNRIFFGNVSKIRAFEILVSTLSSAYTVNKTRTARETAHYSEFSTDK